MTSDPIPLYQVAMVLRTVAVTYRIDEARLLDGNNSRALVPARAAVVALFCSLGFGQTAIIRALGWGKMTVLGHMRAPAKRAPSVLEAALTRLRVENATRSQGAA